MSYAISLRCRKCGGEHPLKPINLCEFCFGPLEVTYDYKAMSATVSRESISRGPSSMWRYKDLLPVNDKFTDLGTGFTPLIKADNLGRELGLDQLYIKNDCVNPTYSFKDRVVAVAISKALEFGFNTVACASTGNLAASVAAHAAKERLDSYVFVPADIEGSKFVGTAIYKPTIVAVKGTYDRVNRLCSQLVTTYKWGFININLRPYYAEGSKTMGYEIAEQMGWRAPDCVVAPAASGLLFTRIWKGLNELSMLRLIPPVDTHMFVAQASGCSPIVNAFKASSLHINPVEPNTIAKSIAIGNPADGHYAVKATRESGGAASASTDEELVQGIELLAQTEGIFAETAGGVVISNLKKLVKAGAIKRSDVTVACITGAGFKTQEAVADIVKLVTIEPTLEAFQEALSSLGRTPASNH